MPPAKKAAKKTGSRGASPKGSRARKTTTATTKSTAKKAVTPEASLASNATSENTDSTQQKAEEISLDGFFQNVASSVLQAQKDLDRKSDEYNRFAGGHPLVTPTVFKMPKVKASIRFAFSETKDGGFNILLFRKGKSSSFESEQTIDFEIAAAPPPPDAMKALQAMTPRIDVVLDSGLRSQLLRLLQDDPKSSGHPALKINVTNRLVLLPTGTESEYFAFAADKQTPQKFSAWTVNLEKQTAELLVDRDTLDAGAASAGIAALVGFLKGSLAGLQDKQERFLSAFQA